MEVLRDFTRPTQGPIVLTIGSFDGVHLGHQHILQRLQNAAKEIGGRSLLVSFDPHPRLVLPQSKPGNLHLLQDESEKIYWLQRYGLDLLALVPFTLDFAAQSPRAYIEDFLVRYFKPSRIVIGYDHRFGKGRAGDLAYLQSLAPEFGYEVEEIPAQTLEDAAVSSTKIRQALQHGEFDQALDLLGHAYSLSGIVVQGQQLGRQLGFPTANLQLGNVHKLVPPAGIYAVRAHVEGQTHEGMLYIGSRPTLAEGLQATIEVHLFDFQGNLYGKFMHLELLHFLRGDARFPDLEALRQALAQDERDIRAWLSVQA